jgi:hypothetical protein
VKFEANLSGKYSPLDLPTCEKAGEDILEWLGFINKGRGFWVDSGSYVYVLEQERQDVFKRAKY